MKPQNNNGYTAIYGLIVRHFLYESGQKETPRKAEFPGNTISFYERNSLGVLLFTSSLFVLFFCGCFRFSCICIRYKLLRSLITIVNQRQSGNDEDDADVLVAGEPQRRAPRVGSQEFDGESPNAVQDEVHAGHGEWLEEAEFLRNCVLVEEFLLPFPDLQIVRREVAEEQQDGEDQEVSGS